MTKWPSDFGDLIPKGNQDIDLRDLYVTSAPQRELEFRSDAKFLKAAMLYRRGDVAARPCTRCALGNGQYQECVHLADYWDGVCANCLETDPALCSIGKSSNQI